MTPVAGKSFRKIGSHTAGQDQDARDVAGSAIGSAWVVEE